MPSASPVKTVHHEAYPAISPTRPELSTVGKTVLITGGARGIGLAVAHAFAASGVSHLALIGRSQSSLDAAKAALASEYPDTEVVVAAGDVTDEASINAAFAAAMAALGGRTIDIVVLNSGYLPEPAPAAAADLDLQDWWKSYTVNVLGLLLSFRAFYRHASPDAILLHMSTAMLHVPAMPTGSGAYASSKAAGLKLVDQISLENPNIRVFNMHPGVIETDMGQKSRMPGQDHGESTRSTAQGFNL
jgi:NAD(P)-dependent dehydrogenase (short-subunit alcohol dehydrogenase family)